MDAPVDLADSVVGRELLAHRNFVYALARRLVRDTETAEDIAQDAVERLLLVQRPNSIRPWLRSVARNLARRFSRIEHRRTEIEGGFAAAPRPTVPTVDEIAHRVELQRHLTARVLALESRSREVVLLHFYEGRTVAETAAQLEIPLETARARLRRALATLRANWNADLGGRREGAGALLFLLQSAPPESLFVATATPIIWTGFIAMATKVKLAAAVALTLAVAGAFVLWQSTDRPRPLPILREASFPPLAGPAETSGTEHSDAVPAISLQRLAESPLVSPDAANGTLVLHAYFARDHVAAAGLTVFVRRRATEDHRLSVPQARTNDAGIARFEELRAGRVYVTSDRGSLSQLIDIRGGETTEHDLEIPEGLNVSGIVIDETGAPVPDALVEVAPASRIDQDAEVLATTDEQGRFGVRDAPVSCYIGARAAGYVASPMKRHLGKAGNEVDVRLELRTGGGMVDGVVVGPDGNPVEDAIVMIGAGSRSGLGGGVGGVPPLPAVDRSDELGQFHAVGIKEGRHPVVARAVGFAPFQGECEVLANATTPFRVSLTSGAIVRGVVRDASGNAANNVEVSFGSLGDFIYSSTRTSMEGRFELEDLPAADIEVRAKHEELGNGTTRLLTVAEATVSCEIQLSRGLVLQGRVVDEQRAPVQDAWLEFLAESAESWFAFVQSDRDGRFTVPNCPEIGALMVTVRGKGIEVTQRSQIDPKVAELELVVRRGADPTARIVGVVVGPDGQPVPNAAVSVMGSDPNGARPHWPTGSDGRFDIGPFASGTWRVRVRTGRYPLFTSALHEVIANSTWDAGTIQLAEAGWAILQIEGDPGGVNFRVIDAAEIQCSEFDFVSDPQQPRSEPLAAGDYRLAVMGNRVAAQTVPFTIRAAAETRLQVNLQPGLRQTIEITPPDGNNASRSVRIRVLRGSELVRTYSIAMPANSATRDDLWLAPGEYTLTASGMGRDERASFTVGSDEGPIVRVDLR